MAKDSADPARSKNVLAVALLGTAIVLAVAWFLMSVTPPSVDEDRLEFELVDIHGSRVALDAERFAGKVLLVDIWGLWCPPCIEQVPYLIDLQNRFGRHGFEIIGVEFAAYYGDDRASYTDALREWANQKGVNYTLVQGGEAADVERVFPTLRDFSGFPTSVLIDRAGTVQLVSQGFAPSEITRFEAIIKRLLTEEAPPN
jgi:thiol-disulfide isomerase/thioredoxin